MLDPTATLPCSIWTIVSAKGVTLDLALVTPIGLIVNELVTNSLKYAFPGGVRSCLPGSGEECTIRILMGKSDGSYLLEVADNGIGLPPGFEIRTSRSLGLKLVYFLSSHQLQTQPEVSTDLRDTIHIPASMNNSHEGRFVHGNSTRFKVNRLQPRHPC